MALLVCVKNRLAAGTTVHNVVPSILKWDSDWSSPDFSPIKMATFEIF